jgi:hypothetical protein
MTVWSIILCLHAQVTFSQLIINEVCASNASIIKDSDGEYGDWIEMLNLDTVPVNLAGYCLSDERDNLSKWCFPEYLISPGEYMLIFASGKNIRTFPVHWNSIIKQGDEWKYILPDENTGPGWRNKDFNDSSWLAGPSGIGYGDGDDATVIPTTISLYMRKHFTIDDTSQISGCVLQIDFDDAFVAFLNGIEFARAGIYGNPPAFSWPAFVGREATMYAGGEPLRYDVLNPSELLIQGENVLAIQVHNISAGSSDLSSIPYFSIQVPQKPANPPPEILHLSSTNFHLNFKLDADGDSLYLTDPEHKFLDSLHIPYIGTDRSLGRRADQPDEWVLFDTATPGNPNTTAYYKGYLEDEPVFSRPGGRFQEAFGLTLSAMNPEDTIYYTTDGSEPGPASFLYEDTISISTDAIIRARIIRGGLLPGRIVSRTYFTGADHHLPVVCISTDPDNLWDYYNGIYTMGPDAQADFPYFDANFWQDWERPVHVELYDEDGNLAINSDAGIKIYGGWTRGLPQKSMAVFARQKYNVDRFHYRLFQDKTISDCETFVLRNSGNDWFGVDWEIGTMFRDVMMTHLTGDLDIEYPGYRQSIVYINGEYWGIQNIREKINEHFIASNAGVSPDQIDLLENNREVLRGDNEHYTNLISFLQNNDIQLDENYTYVKSQMDVQDFVNYQVAEIYYGNEDWPSNNIKYWRPDSPKGKWRWIIYDTDFGFGLWGLNNVYKNSLLFATESNGPDYPNPPWSTFLLRTLLRNRDFRELFINSFADRINTSFRADTVIDLISTLRDNIDEEMFNHVKRWGGSYQNWINRTNDLKSFASIRPGTMLNYLNSTYGLKGKQQLILDVSDQAGGTVKLNTIYINSFPWSGTYFSGNPVELTALPAIGYRFTGWTGSIVSNDPKIRFDPVTAMTVMARFEPDQEVPGNPVVINEICYNQDPGQNSGDWVELYNNSSKYVDISGWILKDSEDAHSFAIRIGTILDPFGFYVICRSRISFETVYPEVGNYGGDFDFGFSSGGETIRLYTGKGVLVDSVRYGIYTPWPIIPDNSGYTLALKDPGLDNSLPGSWNISSYRLGTPGGNNSFALGGGDDSYRVQKDILYQNSPNPFSRETRIIFYSGITQPVRLSIYDLHGRIIKVLSDQTLETGFHEFEWVPENQSDGIYILRVETPASVHTRMMLKTR